jgi:hypothetical protein
MVPPPCPIPTSPLGGIPVLSHFLSTTTQSSVDRGLKVFGKSKSLKMRAAGKRLLALLPPSALPLAAITVLHDGLQIISKDPAIHPLSAFSRHPDLN